MDAPVGGSNDLAQRGQARHESVEDAEQALGRNGWGEEMHSAFPLRGFGPEGVR